MAAIVTEEKQSDMVQRIRSESLPRDLHPLIEEYERVTEDRDELLWKWLWHVFPRFELSSVADQHTGAARRAKFCFSLYMTVLDDVSERHRDRATFDAGRKIPFEGSAAPDASADADAEILELLNHAWMEVERQLQQAPREDRFGELFDFDLRQSLNTMDYNRLINEGPQLANCGGVDRYDTHNMLLFLYTDIDLAFSPSFDTGDLATLREVTWEAQKLARIGNWVTTWERELREDDYTSKVVVEAMERGVVSRDELQSATVPNDALARQIRETDIERELLLRWNRIYGELCRAEHDLVSVDVDSFVDGIRYLLEVDVKMRGLK